MQQSSDRLDGTAFSATVLQRLTWATAVPALMMLVAMVMKPAWRDEFWTLYLTDPAGGGQPFSIEGLHLDFGHPPLYPALMYLWRFASSSEIWARGFSLAVLVAGFLVVRQLWRGRPELVWFLLMCAGSYWIVYFATEIRSYVLLFVLCAISVVVAARAIEDKRETVMWAAVWCCLGITLGLTHYFGALWVACLGLCVGLTHLQRKSPVGFFAWGVASAAALVPVALWISASFHDATPDAIFADTEGGSGNALAGGAEQFLRGLFVKLIGSNVALAVAAVLGAAALLRRREPIDLALLGAVVLMVLISFALQVFWLPLVKERSFIVIMPALIFVGARAITSLATSSLWGRRALLAAPYVAAITPFAFIPEYFKDREVIGEVATLLRTQGEGCSGAPVVAFFSGGKELEGLHRWVSERIVKDALPGGVPPPVLINADTMEPQSAGRLVSACKIRAVAFVMPRNAGPEHERAKAALRRAGVPIEALVEHRFGKMRQLVYTAR